MNNSSPKNSTMPLSDKSQIDMLRLHHRKDEVQIVRQQIEKFPDIRINTNQKAVKNKEKNQSSNTDAEFIQII